MTQIVELLQIVSINEEQCMDNTAHTYINQHTHTHTHTFTH